MEVDMTFLKFFNDNVVRIRLVDKDESWFMKLVSALISIGNFLRICNIKDDPDTSYDESFMGGYGTTIGTTIYDNPGWTWDKPPSPHVVHELTHAVQSLSPLMALRYVFSEKWRMFYESEAVQAEVLCFPDSVDTTWMARRVEQFAAYGIRDAHMIKKTLSQRLYEVGIGSPRASAARVYAAFKEWVSLQR